MDSILRCSSYTFYLQHSVSQNWSNLSTEFHQVSWSNVTPCSVSGTHSAVHAKLCRMSSGPFHLCSDAGKSIPPPSHHSQPLTQWEFTCMHGHTSTSQIQVWCKAFAKRGSRRDKGKETRWERGGRLWTLEILHRDTYPQNKYAIFQWLTHLLIFSCWLNETNPETFLISPKCPYN